MSQAEKWRWIGAYFCSLSGGYWPFAKESSTVNQIIHLYIWLAFVTVPFVIRLLAGSRTTFGKLKKLEFSKFLGFSETKLRNFQCFLGIFRKENLKIAKFSKFLGTFKMFVIFRKN